MAWGCWRMWEGDSAATRRRKRSTNFGAYPSNRSDGKPIARSARNLAISASALSTPTGPGSRRNKLSGNSSSSPSARPRFALPMSVGHR